MSHARPRIAALVPSTFLLDGEFCAIAEELGAQAHLFRVPSPEISDNGDAGAVADMVRFMGEPPLLARIASEAAQVTPDRVVWACTSGSFIDGGAMGLRQADAMSGALGGVPAITTSAAMLAALDRIDARRIAVVTPYHPPIGERFVTHLREAGLEVVLAEHLGGGSDEAVGAIDPQRYSDAIARASDDFDAIAIPCTAVSERAVGPVLEAVTARPVVFANRATLAEALALAW